MNTNSASVRDWYDKNLESYLKTGDVLLKELLNEFLAVIPKGGKILDMGSGTGRDVGYFSERGYDATGIDFSREMIKHAKQNFQGLFLEKDFMHTGFDEDSFDAAWSSSAVLTHLDQTESTQALAEIVRVVKPNGIFGGIVMRGTGGLIGALSKKGFIFNQYSEEELRNTLDKKNINILSSKIFNYNNRNWIFFLARLPRK